ncbi:hypothetical protein MIND_01181700 [Mycena indigotica]|uniref:F-box domain-containing protein n=1 Tax=Mycena indigotica TaxID=2126181 RepID=A0A8H6S6Q8_9AGAR|nr:uncharacterized protein MIND_01181700 [Mycena indigotica]KAF7292827.1 hypothetical protein MIND_01181700 [Mycena indigotica]
MQLPTPAKMTEQELHDKYRKLKRRFFELEERHRETSTELQRSGERNSQMEEERNQLLERITELESQPGFTPPANGRSSPSPQLNDHEEPILPAPAPHTRNRKGKGVVLDQTSETQILGRLEDVSSQDLDWVAQDDELDTIDDADTSGDYILSPNSSKRPRNPIDQDLDAPTAKIQRRSSDHKTVTSASSPPAPQSVSVPISSHEAKSESSVPRPYNPYTFLTPTGGGIPPYSYLTPYPYWSMPGMPYMPPPQMMPPQPPQSLSSQHLPIDGSRPTKPKRLKAHTVTSKSYNIPMVPRDKQGKPMLPLNVGIMTVISLGDVCMREHFHTERYIFPVGYEVTRRYLSTIDRNAEVVYHCTILDGGDGPKFQIIPSDAPDRPIIAGTATGAWSNIVKQANALRQRQHSNSVSGPDFFGFGQNTIKHLIQELPNADRLRDYVWQHFVEGGPLGGRHAAVIPALPEEYKSTTPLGSYYPAHITPNENSQPPKSLSASFTTVAKSAISASTPVKLLPGAFGEARKIDRRYSSWVESVYHLNSMYFYRPGCSQTFVSIVLFLQAPTASSHRHPPPVIWVFMLQRGQWEELHALYCGDLAWICLLARLVLVGILCEANRLPTFHVFNKFPLDIGLAILAQCSPYDLLQLSKTSHSFRNLIFDHAATLWTAARQNLVRGDCKLMPPCPQVEATGNYSQSAYFTWIFEEGPCTHCSRPTDSMPFLFALRHRACSSMCKGELTSPARFFRSTDPDIDVVMREYGFWLPRCAVGKTSQDQDIYAFERSSLRAALQESNITRRSRPGILADTRRRNTMELGQEYQKRARSRPALEQNAQQLQDWLKPYENEMKKTNALNSTFLKYQAQAEKKAIRQLLKCPSVVKIMKAFTRDLTLLTANVWLEYRDLILDELKVIQLGRAPPSTPTLFPQDKVACPFCSHSVKAKGLVSHVCRKHPTQNPDHLYFGSIQDSGKRHCGFCPGSQRVFTEAGLERHTLAMHPDLLPLVASPGKIYCSDCKGSSRTFTEEGLRHHYKAIHAED